MERYINPWLNTKQQVKECFDFNISEKIEVNLEFEIPSLDEFGISSVITCSPTITCSNSFLQSTEIASLELREPDIKCTIYVASPGETNKGRLIFQASDLQGTIPIEEIYGKKENRT